MSYEYLQEDVIPVKLCKVVGRIEERVVQLSEKDEERAMRLHQESIVIDFHNHLTVLPEDPKDIETLARSGRPATGFEGVKNSGMTACLHGFGGSMGRRSSPTPWQFNDVIWDMGIRQADMDHHQDVVMRGYSVKDILEAKKSGKTAVIPHIENAQLIDNDLDRLDMLYGLGVRCMGLTYNTRTTIADGCTERTDCGLSSFGFKVIERMNRLGMLIDLSHSSHIATKETIEASKAPCCCTHTFAQGVYNNPRGKSDDLLKLLTKRGGLIGVAAVPNLISNKEVQTVFDVIDHVDYLVKLVGIDHVAIGTDAMFGDHVGLHKYVRGIMDMTIALKELPATHVEYIENPGQFPNITRALVARGYSDDEIKKIIGGNVLRLLEKTIG
ncbi:MAG: membrane dipeptidase [Deltaproteobacteria bacterium]|nr:membrane dipeptidase [Deltaproteobacteria bacterium]MBW2308217.1 membrane dipeptidase [Deltaproteobacteria bacterium]